MASQITISGEDLNARPVARPGEILEAVPGLIVTQHSGEGKANQYFLRGYNLDHGTDLAIFVDDVPVNMRTHAHGQGYADLNWLMPETVGRLDVRKGPYYADEGDFGSAGNLHIGLIDSVPKAIAQMTAGGFGYLRFFGMESSKVGDGTLLIAGETGTYDGPWVNPDNARKLNGLVRYTQGTALDGFSITGMAYSNRWTSTDQVPLRAIEAGFIDRFGSEDPTDGGKTNRFALSGRIAGTDDAGSWKANAYIVKSQLDLFNNFTYFLSDPVLGDQFHQHDDRIMAGGNASRTLDGSLAGRAMQTTFGIQTRYDDIALALTDTFQRSFLSNVRSDKVGEASIGVYAQSTVTWTDWLRTTIGWRGDYYDAHVNSIFDANNSGHVSAGIGSPKFTMAIGPFNKTEFFVGAGYGMHSNDARGATITEDPADPANKQSASPLLVRTKGLETGVRTRIIAEPRFLAQPVHARSGFRNHLLGRRRRHRSEPAEPALRLRIDQSLSPVIMDRHRRRSGDDACAFRRLRQRAGRRLCLARRFPAGADRQCTRQLHSQRARDGGLCRHHAWREDRPVRHVALALSRRDAADGRQRLPLAGHQHLQRSHRLS